MDNANTPDPNSNMEGVRLIFIGVDNRKNDTERSGYYEENGTHLGKSKSDPGRGGSVFKYRCEQITADNR